jgi:D-alanine-D-alanine ligase and related ATP-grasp enzymes
MRIGFCFNVLHDDSGTKMELDFDAPETIDGIAKTLEELGHKVISIEADEDIFEKLKNVNVDLVFNIAEGLYGDARESWVPMACEILKIPYTHSTPTTLALCLDKKLCKLAVAGLGVLVPAENKFPAIIKPVGEGSSMGIFNDNIVENIAKSKMQVAKMRKMGIDVELMVEEYIDGREFTVGILAGEVLPIIEQKFDMLPKNMHKIAGYEMKWKYEVGLKNVYDAVECPAKINAKLKKQIEDICKKIYVGLGIRDCARIDLRMNEKDEIYFLEINPLPGLIPDEKILSYFPLSARRAGYSYKEVLQKILSRSVKLAVDKDGRRVYKI